MYQPEGPHQGSIHGEPVQYYTTPTPAQAAESVQQFRAGDHDFAPEIASSVVELLRGGFIVYFGGTRFGLTERGMRCDVGIGGIGG